MHREGTIGGRFLIQRSGTYLGAAYENTPYRCVKAIERMHDCINQGGTAGYPVPMGMDIRRFWFISALHYRIRTAAQGTVPFCGHDSGKENYLNGKR